MNIWRIKDKTNASENHNQVGIAGLMIHTNTLMLGWELKLTSHSINSFSDYEKAYKKDYGMDVNRSVRRLALEIQPDDIVFLISNKEYWIGKVFPNSAYRYVSSIAFPYVASHVLDCSNQRTGIIWHKLEDVFDGSCPLSDLTARLDNHLLMPGDALRRIHDDVITKVAASISDKL